MKILPALILLLTAVFSSAVHAASLGPDEVVVVYNEASKHGMELALEYAGLRKIPAANIIPVHCSVKEAISRAEFDADILQPLRKKAREREWWVFGNDREAPFVERKIYAMVLISGVPLKIVHPKSTPEEKIPAASTTAASVDSELSLMAFEGVPLKGSIPNPYFNKDEGVVDGRHFPLLVTRLDSPSPETTRQMMKDAVSVEKTGLWGWTVIDIGGPYPLGDNWLKGAADLAEKNGFPVMVDEWKKPLPRGYPVSTDIAVYFGWYAGKLSGPFIDPEFKFRPGAIAAHIHSFSASTVRSVVTGWAGPLVTKGAAVSLGNVYEPFLNGSHHLHIFYDRLLKGYTVAEAAGMSIPVLSWHSTVLGDPLYRPFAVQHSGQIKKMEPDRFFQAWWLANREWPGDPSMRRIKLEDAAATGNPQCFFWEALAYEAVRKKDKSRAENYFKKAIRQADRMRDKVRNEMELQNLLRSGSNDDVFFRNVMDALISRYAATPYVEAMREWKNRVTPPPPKDAGKKKK